MRYAKPPITVKVIVDSMTQFSIRMTPIHESDEVNFTHFPRRVELEGDTSDIPDNCLPAVRRMFDKNERVVVRNEHGQQHPHLVLELTDKLTMIPV